MFIYHTFARPYVSANSAAIRRQLAGPTMNKEDINLAAATRAAQIEAGAEIDEIIKALDKKAARARDKKAARAREQKLAKAQEQKAAQDRKQNITNPRGNQCPLDKRPSSAPRTRSERFVSLPSGLTLSRSDLAETKRRASSQFGCGPRFAKDDICTGIKASTSNRHDKGKQAAISESRPKPSTSLNIDIKEKQQVEQAKQRRFFISSLSLLKTLGG
ncbi:hypothetical protein E4U55_004016 [Claviceps digitariae]|nr:hypothetical protein E4U55_004016 [Claviceps digitariae]